MKKKPEVYSSFLRNAKDSFLASARALHNVAPKPTTRIGNKNHFRLLSPSQIALVLKVPNRGARGGREGNACQETIVFAIPPTNYVCKINATVND